MAGLGRKRPHRQSSRSQFTRFADFIRRPAGPNASLHRTPLHHPKPYITARDSSAAWSVASKPTDEQSPQTTVSTNPISAQHQACRCATIRSVGRAIRRAKPPDKRSPSRHFAADSLSALRGVRLQSIHFISPGCCNRTELPESSRPPSNSFKISRTGARELKPRDAAAIAGSNPPHRAV